MIKYFKKIVVFATLFVGNNSFSQTPFSVNSPDRNMQVNVWLKEGQLRYTVSFQNQPLLKESRLGIVCEEDDFSQGLKNVGATTVQPVKDRYELFTGKRRIISYAANKRILHLQNSKGKNVDVIFQVSNDGVAFQYFLPDLRKEEIIKEELTSFHFDTTARAFLQPMQVAKSGWEKTNPAYEEHYLQNIPVTTLSPSGAGWVYPALFNNKNVWILISEAGMDGRYCASRLSATSPDGEYKLRFPDAKEVIQNNGLLPRSSVPFSSPWRIITIGSLKTIVESTLGTDLAKPAISFDKTFIKPGKASWSWIMSKDDSIVYTEQVRYIDFAAKMHWQYCLVDAAWDQKIGYEKIGELAAYAANKNVGLLLWYNSAGDWNTVKYTPKNKLLTHDDRMKEFRLLKDMGIKGVKIDFFGGDGQSVMKYYVDILNDAATVGLMVNFHGATVPRGWQRTYPNLLTTEAVRGFEMITFNQADADAEAAHCAMLPFARNAFDPMDFTPMNLYKIPTRVKRKTTSAFELATAVLFLSGIQHFAESPEGMTHVPEYVQQFLQDLPTRWDDVRFIDGYPGKYVVIARKAGNKWYIAGINGENTERKMEVDLSLFKTKTATLITDGAEPLSFLKQNFSSNKKQVTIKPQGGFVMVLE